MFITTTSKELDDKKIGQLDIILITGDAYIDSPFSGVSVIARVLEKGLFWVFYGNGRKNLIL